MGFIICFLIVCVLVVGISFSPVAEKRKAEAKRQQEVNLPLQREVAKRWKKIVKREIDEPHPEVINLYSYALSLCDKHHVPNTEFGNSPTAKEIEWNAYLSEKREREMVEQYFMQDYNSIVVNGETIKINRDGKSTEDILKEIRDKYTIRQRIDGVPFWEEYKKRYSYYRHFDEQNNKDDWSDIQYATRNNEAHTMILTWWCGVMSRAMRNLGYTFSRMYEDDNDYDRLIKSYEDAIKYPWKHDAVYLAKAKKELPIYKKLSDKRKQKQEAEAKAYRERFEGKHTYHFT